MNNFAICLGKENRANGKIFRETAQWQRSSTPKKSHEKPIFLDLRQWAPNADDIQWEYIYIYSSGLSFQNVRHGSFSQKSISPNLNRR